MNKRVKKIWIEGLRSGKYKQGIRALEVDGALCCLGVLCRVLEEDEEFPVRRVPTHVDGRLAFNYKTEAESGNLPEALRVDLEIPRRYLSPCSSGGLPFMNDFENKNFLEIADFIEENL